MPLVAILGGILWTLDNLISCGAFQAPGVIGDVCYYEDFRARCPRNEIISMELARYGDLGSGRCFDEDGGEALECAGDVLGLADSMCSGKRDCTIKIPNPEFDHSKKCLERIRGFFKGKYSCHKVTPLQGLCQSGGGIPLSKAPTVLSSVDVAQSPCPSTLRHLQLHAAPGQQVNVSLTDYSWAAAPSSPRPACLLYGHVVDRQLGRREALCGGRQRHSVVMLSISSSVQLDLATVDPSQRFLLTFQAVGCGDISPPKGAWMNRSHAEVTMGCAATGQVWQLRCVDSQWLGPQVQCLPASHEEPETETGARHITLPNDIIIAIIASIAFLLAVLIITTGVIFYKRSERQKLRVLQQQQQVIRTLRLRPKPSAEDPTYLSPAFIQQSRPTSGHRPESAYESIHVFNRTLSNPDTSTLPPPPASMLVDTSTATLRQQEEDPYNASQASSSTYTNPLKYFVLDKNLVTTNTK